MGPLFERMMAVGGNPAVVLDAHEQVVGIVTTPDVERAVAFHVADKQPMQSGG